MTETAGRPQDRLVDLVLTSPDCVVTSAEDWSQYDYVAIDKGRIHSMGRGVAPRARSEVDARGCLVSPGLVNVHHHFFQNLARAYAPGADQDLFGWLNSVYELWPRVTRDHVYHAAWVACAELLLGGCTTAVDHFSLAPVPGADPGHEIVRAAAETGLRIQLMRGVMDRSGDDDRHGRVAGSAEDYLTVLAELVAAHHDDGPLSMARIGVAPPAIFSVSGAMLETLSITARERGLSMHIHASESAGEVALAKQRWGISPIQRLADTGWLGPDVWIAHAVILDRTDLDLIADSGTSIAHCPSSNMLLASGAAPVAELLSRGVNVGLGTDGSASSDTGSMWLEARSAMMMARLTGGPGALTARQSFALATAGGAGCINRPELGSLGTGSPADLVLWDVNRPEFAGAISNPVDALLRCGPPRARDVLVAGRWSVRDGTLVAPGLAHQLELHKIAAAEVQAVEGAWRR